MNNEQLAQKLGDLWRTLNLYAKDALALTQLDTYVTNYIEALGLGADLADFLRTKDFTTPRVLGSNPEYDSVILEYVYQRWQMFDKNKLVETINLRQIDVAQLKDLETAYAAQKERLAVYREARDRWKIKWEKVERERQKQLYLRAQGLLNEAEKTSPALQAISIDVGAVVRVAQEASKIKQADPKTPADEIIRRLSQRALDAGIAPSATPRFLDLVVLLSKEQGETLATMPFGADIEASAFAYAQASAIIETSLPQAFAGLSPEETAAKIEQLTRGLMQGTPTAESVNRAFKDLRLIVPQDKLNKLAAYLHLLSSSNPDLFGSALSSLGRVLPLRPPQSFLSRIYELPGRLLSFPRAIFQGLTGVFQGQTFGSAASRAINTGLSGLSLGINTGARATAGAIARGGGAIVATAARGATTTIFGLSQTAAIVGGVILVVVVLLFFNVLMTTNLSVFAPKKIVSSTPATGTVNSVYIDVKKDVSQSVYTNAAAKGAVLTYTVTVGAPIAGSPIAIKSFENKARFIKTGGETAFPLPDITNNFVGKTVDPAAKTPLVATYIIALPSDDSINDSLLIDSISVTATTPEGDETSYASASVTIGTPPGLICNTIQVSSGASRRYCFPVVPAISVSPSCCHHDYVASDIMTKKDLPSPQVVAFADGKIVAVGTDDIAGIFINELGDDGYIYSYFHLSSTQASTGQIVVAGQPLGTQGETGNAKGTGEHTHFQILTRIDCPYDDAHVGYCGLVYKEGCGAKPECILPQVRFFVSPSGVFDILFDGSIQCVGGSPGCGGSGKTWTPN